MNCPVFNPAEFGCKVASLPSPYLSLPLDLPFKCSSLGFGGRKIRVSVG